MRIRPLAALSAIALTGILLAGCSGGAAPTPTDSTPAAADLCAVAAASGAASDAVTVDGDAGAESTATFTAPLEITELQRTVISEGTGDPITSGALVNLAFTAYDADTGSLLGTLGYDEGSFLPQQVSAESPLGQMLGCATVGSRLVLVLPPTESGAGQVYVMDVLGTTPTAAWGDPQAPVDGMPTVTLADDGTPTIEIPDTPAPTEIQIADLKKGDGAVVADGDTVLVQYTGVSWDTGENFDSSWAKSGPTSMNTQQVYAGFGQALVGQTVGSQVLVVMPPELGDTNGDLKGQTLVFVIDILATQHAATQ